MISMKKINKSWGFDTDFYRHKSWLVIRDNKINENPLCELCEGVGMVTPACFVDHIIPRRITTSFENDTENLQSLCDRCHSQKTQLERKYVDLHTFIKEMDTGKLQYICTHEKKDPLFQLVKNRE